MNANRLPLVGLVIMIIVAIFALALQQQAVNDLRAQMTRAAVSDNDKATAVAMMQVASATQGQAEVGQATAQAAANAANTAQATAVVAAGTAAALVDDAGTRSAQFAATSTANTDALLATATMHANNLADLQAEATAEVATLQSQIAEQSTVQAQIGEQLATATAQVDLAEFARQAAEDDRTNALNQLWAIGTRQADSSRQLATAQILLTGLPPATATPPPTPIPQATTVESATTAPASTSGTVSLAQTYQSTDKKTTVGYPDGWFAQETKSGTIIIVNQEALFSRSQYKLAQGEVEVDILAGTYVQFNLTPGMDPAELLNSIVTNIKSQQTKFTAGDVTSLTVNGHKAARIIGNDGDNDLSITVTQLSDSALAVIYGLAASGEGAASADTVNAIVSSIAYAG